MNSPPERDGPQKQKDEERALDALVAAALREQGLHEMTFERLVACERDLTREDREALEARASEDAGRDLIDRALSRSPTGESPRRAVPRGPSRGDSVPNSGPARRTDREDVPGAESWKSARPKGEQVPSKGAKVMKSLVLSLLVVSGLAGVIVVGTREDGVPAGGAAIDRETLDLVVNRLDLIERRLGSLSDLESRVDGLASRLASSRAPGGASAVASGDGVTRNEPARGSEPDEQLRDYIVRVMDEVREEKAAEQRRLAEDRRRQLLALHEGPYGPHNYRINTMAKRLDLSDRQKQHYYLNLVEYNQLIAQSRERESQDQENRQQYRDERSRIRGEFSQVVQSVLTPEQSEIFSSLPSHEQRPDGGVGFTTATLQVMPGMEAGEAVIGVVPDAAQIEDLPLRATAPARTGYGVETQHPLIELEEVMAEQLRAMEAMEAMEAMRAAEEAAAKKKEAERDE